MPAHDWVTPAAAGYRGGRPLALLFDYDGTLAPIAAHPALATLPPTTKDVLAGLAELPRVTVGVLSGRSLDSVRGLVGLPGLRYAGSGGMHLELCDEEVIDPALAAFDGIADALATVLSVPVHSFPGAWVERKPGCLSLHYRRLLPLDAVCFVAEARAALADLAPDCPPLRVREVTQALEVALAGAWTKGDAVDRLASAGALVVYAGDGANDEEAVVAVNARGGLTVGVGPDAPEAVRVRVADQTAFEAELYRLAGSLCSAADVGNPPAGGVATGHAIHQGVR